MNNQGAIKSITHSAAECFSEKCASNGILVSKISRTLYFINLPNRKPIHCKVYASCGRHFKLHKSECSNPKSLFVYVWDADISPTCFILTCAEAMQVLGPKPLKTKAWRENGYYSWSSATGLPKKRSNKLETFYKERWGWLVKYLSCV